VEYYANFIDRREATKIRDTLIKEVPWEKEQIVIYGQKITAPRLGTFFYFVGRPDLLTIIYTQYIHSVTRVYFIATQVLNESRLRGIQSC
jgi:hypothetical protein